MSKQERTATVRMLIAGCVLGGCMPGVCGAAAMQAQAASTNRAGSASSAAAVPAGALARPLTGTTSEQKAYVLGIGDTLSIDIADMPEVSTKAVKIAADGSIDLPLVGSVQAAGLNARQFRSVMEQKASKYVTNPQVTINVVTNLSRFVSVIGEVNTPGLRPLDGPRSLIEVISEAGGVKSDAGPRVIITRPATNGVLPSVGTVQSTTTGNSTRLVVSLNELMSSSSPASNITLLPGDVVSVPKEQLVYVVGDVKRAGGFPMSSQENVSVLQALSLAEGSNPNASLKGAKILRPIPGSSTPTELPVNLDAILAGKAPDQSLAANDVLFVPKSAAKSGAKRAAEVMLQVATGIAIYR